MFCDKDRLRCIEHKLDYLIALLEGRSAEEIKKLAAKLKQSSDALANAVNEKKEGK